ncbi:hypothetical protein CRG98_014497, partial [Punica granatum]
MELRSSFHAVFLLFLLVSAASTPTCTSTGRLLGQEAMEDVYEIDYRGPETHSSSFPPPSHSHHDIPWIHRKSAGEPTHEPKKTLSTKHK